MGLFAHILAGGAAGGFKATGEIADERIANKRKLGLLAEQEAIGQRTAEYTDKLAGTREEKQRKFLAEQEKARIDAASQQEQARYLHDIEKLEMSGEQAAALEKERTKNQRELEEFKAGKSPDEVRKWEWLINKGIITSQDISDSVTGKGKLTDAQMAEKVAATRIALAKEGLPEDEIVRRIEGLIADLEPYRKGKKESKGGLPDEVKKSIMGDLGMNSSGGDTTSMGKKTMPPGGTKESPGAGEKKSSLQQIINAAKAAQNAPQSTTEQRPQGILGETPPETDALSAKSLAKSLGETASKWTRGSVNPLESIGEGAGAVGNVVGKGASAVGEMAIPAMIDKATDITDKTKKELASLINSGRATIEELNKFYEDRAASRKANKEQIIKEFLAGYNQGK